jgi:hypothetical protein
MDVVLRLALPIGVSVLLGLLIRCLRPGLGRRGAGVIAGVCAGVALGPWGFGSVAPEVYERVMVGGVENDARARAVRDRIQAETRGLIASGASEVAASEHAAGLELEAYELEQRAAGERALRSGLATACAVSFLMLAALASAPPDGVRPGGLLVGVIGGVFALVIWGVAHRLVLGSGLWQACLFGAAMAGGAIAGGGATRSAGIGLLSVSALGVAVFGGAWEGFMLVGVVACAWALKKLGPAWRRGELPHAITEGVLLPGSGALALSQVSGALTLDGWLLVALGAVFAGDALCVGVWFGSRLMGKGWMSRHPLGAWALLSGRGVAGWQLGLMSLALAGGRWAEGSAAGAAGAYAIAAAAVAGELSRGAVLGVLRRLPRSIRP